MIPIIGTQEAFVDELESHVDSAIAAHLYSFDPVCLAVIRCFNKLYYGARGASQPWFRNRWAGVPIFKCPEDLLIYQELLHEMRFDTIIECGVAYGGTTLYLAQLCQLMGHGEIVAIDITLERVVAKVFGGLPVTFIQGSSTAESTAERAGDFVKSKSTLVILDSDHSEAHVFRELELYAPMADYLIVEDTNVNGHPVYLQHGPGPHEAVVRFLATHPEWTIDHDRTRLLLTFNPNGYLKRTEAK